MTPHKQLIWHDPENGQYGDCFRTAIACLLNLHPSEVPHFADHDATCDQLHEDAAVWLASRNLFLASFVYEDSLDRVLAMMGAMNAGLHYILMGQSKVANHCVIALGDQIVFDPSITNDDLTQALIGPCRTPCKEDGYYWIYVICVNGK